MCILLCDQIFITRNVFPNFRLVCVVGTSSKELLLIINIIVKELPWIINIIVKEFPWIINIIVKELPWIINIIVLILRQSFYRSSLLHLYLADVDECLSTPCPVNGICRNTFGSYNCSCLPGMSHNKLNNLCEGKQETVGSISNTVLFSNVILPPRHQNWRTSPDLKNRDTYLR